MAEYSRAKLETLENAVLTKSPNEVSAVFRQLGELMNTARALGLACRFKGLAYVKALVEGGANFSYTRPEGAGGYYTIFYWLAPLNINETLRKGFFIDIRDGFFTDSVRNTSIRREEIKSFTVLPIEQRTEIVKYLCKNREKVCLDIDELLYYSIMSGSKPITKVLKEYGARLSEKRLKELTDSGRDYHWTEFCYMMEALEDKECIPILSRLTEELEGKAFRYTDSVFWANYHTYNNRTRLYDPKLFKFILEHFNQKKMNKKQLMTGAINENSVECLKICAKLGWLDMPRKRDEMINYASENEKTECTAFLLDFKNRTADLKAEREKAEKKMMRELNANPDSVTELRKIWGFEKREDGTVVITRYRGRRTEIEVPEKIGSMTVKEIGENAFSAEAPRLRTEQIGLRQNITRITLPKTVEIIGENAFSGCSSLREINIPEGVREIGAHAFSSCLKLTEIRIPPHVNEIGKWAFASCTNIASVILPHGITEIKEKTFYRCISLKSLSIPDTVRIIGRGAFQLCISLETAVIPEGTEEIGCTAFAGCKKLKSVTLPQSVKKMKNYKYKDRELQTVFYSDEDLTVTVSEKSYAEKYCKRNNIPYKIKERD